MKPKLDQQWCKSLEGQKVGSYTLTRFVGAGNIGYVYQAERTDFPSVSRAVKLVFELNQGWESELTKVLALELVPGVVHFHELGSVQISKDGRTHLCQYSVWDYISPGENLRTYIARMPQIHTSFLVAVLERILHVLHACEQKQISRHGDLHSGNILIGDALSNLDTSLRPIAPIYVSDFGYGATGAIPTPKDDYHGLALIINEIIARIDHTTANATDRQTLQSIQQRLGKLLKEPPGPERRKPYDLLEELSDIKQKAKATASYPATPIIGAGKFGSKPSADEIPSVGQFQVSEMIGDHWIWWQRLFVPTVPARSRILALDIPTVVTGPRGCGKTMLFRRLSERLVVECGEVTELNDRSKFVALYVNANDFADAFSHFPDKPTPTDAARLTCYANLCVLGELLEVQSARAGKLREQADDGLLTLVRSWLVPKSDDIPVEGEDQLSMYRTILEQIKWKFPFGISVETFPGYQDLSQHRWLPYFIQRSREYCPWISDRALLLFVDDFSTPRVSISMQRVLNRLFLQRSPQFLAKVATEASSTFVSEDSSGKQLQSGDDFQLVDMGEESLFLPDSERLAFLNEVFSRRLATDPRISPEGIDLTKLLGLMPLSKTEFARRLRNLSTEEIEESIEVIGNSQRRGRSRRKVTYFGANVLADLWSGDTRTMIQVVSDVVGQASEATQSMMTSGQHLSLPINSEIQDRAFRNRGGEWLNSHTRNEPTDPKQMRLELSRMQKIDPAFALSGEYGDHLRAVVEAFVSAARELLLGPTYRIQESGAIREVPRMAFRIEIIDEFRLDGLAREIYRDLVRYGLFMRDSRGKSVRGTFVPRLYLRRLLLPFCALALSKRDSVQLSCDLFTQLLLKPDEFKTRYSSRRAREDKYHGQTELALEPIIEDTFDPAYDDIGSEEASLDVPPAK